MKIYGFLILLLLISLADFNRTRKNNVVHRFQPRGARIKVLFCDDNPNHYSDRIYVGLGRERYFLLEVQYDITMKDLLDYWMTGEELADFNRDGIVNFIDFAAF